MGRLASMLADMVQQVLLAGERFGAEVTAVWCLASVPHDVIREVLLAGERLAANLTTEGRVVGVGAHVVG